MTASCVANFKRNYQAHLKRKGLQPKTIEAYSRAIRRIGEYFDNQLNELSEQQLTDYFIDLLGTHSWSTVKLDLDGLIFYYTHALHKCLNHIDLTKPRRAQHLPDIVTIEEAGRLTMETFTLSYRVFYYISCIKRFSPPPDGLVQQTARLCSHGWQVPAVRS